jgi:hypothetical protein
MEKPNSDHQERGLNHFEENTTKEELGAKAEREAGERLEAMIGRFRAMGVKVLYDPNDGKNIKGTVI